MAEPLRGIVRARVTKSVTIPTIMQLVEHVGGLAGCRTCGLMGIDLQITGEPVESPQMPTLPGVTSVSFGG